jgi:predicted RNase H-like nuclease
LKRLLESGWNHDVNPAVDRGRVGRWLFEVYPHPAHVVLFDLPRIIKYKKGPLAQRRAGLKELQTAIVADLGRGRPRLVRSEVLSELTGHPLDSLRGKMLKRHEDELDALLCAYVAAHYWTWGPERNEMFGSMDDGYIVNPARTVQGRDWSFRKHPQAPAFDTSPVAPIAAQRGSLTTSGGAQ